MLKEKEHKTYQGPEVHAGCCGFNTDTCTLCFVSYHNFFVLSFLLWVVIFWFSIDFVLSSVWTLRLSGSL